MDALAPRLPLLQLFEIEKALYELRYELRSRPDWVALPLNDLLAILT
jgi:maltose alpha-D-glucosyltransferase/alpha-amylase